MNILLVDQDRELVEMLAFAFKRAGFNVVAAHDAATALKLPANQEPDLVISEVSLDPFDGYELLSRLRQRSQVPVILLTSRNTEEDQLRGFELGADDYLTKPFSYRVLLARVRAVLRHNGGRGGPSAQPQEMVLEARPLRLHPAQHRVYSDGHQVHLTPTEFRLLRYLMTSPGAVVSTAAILKEVWGFQDPDASNLVRTTVHRLRQKLEEDPTQPVLLHTVPGVGVMLTVLPHAKPCPIWGACSLPCPFLLP